MTKKKVEKPRRELTKRQLSRWQQQKRRQRIALGLGFFIIAVVLGIIGGGWYVTQYRPLHQTVIKVNDTKFNMNYFIKVLKYFGQSRPINYILVDEVVTIIERNELMRQGAMKPDIDISVSNKTVNEELKRHNLSKDHRDLVKAELLAIKLRDEYFEPTVPVFAKQRHIMVMLLESESQAIEVKARLENGEGFADLAGELSLEGFSKLQEGDLGWRPENVLAVLFNTSIPGEHAFSAGAGVLSQPVLDETVNKVVGYWLIELLDRTKDKERVNVRIILLGSEEEAQGVRDSLEAGKDFAVLAQEFSQDELSGANGGDVGWVDTDILSPAFKDFVLGAELETFSEPVRDEAVITTGGYWLLKVVGIDDNREISGEDRNLLKAKALNDWVLALWDDPENEIESYLDDEKKGWVLDQVLKNS